MKQAAEYRRHAVECRELAFTLEGAAREQLLSMAETWDRLALERERHVQDGPEPERRSWQSSDGAE